MFSRSVASAPCIVLRGLNVLFNTMPSDLNTSHQQQCIKNSYHTVKRPFLQCISTQAAHQMQYSCSTVIHFKTQIPLTVVKRSTRKRSMTEQTHYFFLHPALDQ